MRFAQAWIVATRDLALIRQRKGLLASIIGFPLGAGIGLPLVVQLAGRATGGIPAAYLPHLLDAFAFFFIIGAATIPTALAAYSLVGEKVERSLEPLLATPTTDSEILLGKSIAAWLPPVLATSFGGTVYMILIDRTTVAHLGYYYYPNWGIALILGVLAPLACLLSVEVSVLVSVRATNVPAAQQTVGLIVLPFAALYVAGEIGVLPLNTSNLLLVAAAIAAADILLFFASRALFGREEILTRWR